MIIVAPLTSKRRGYPSHVEIEGLLGETSYIPCELLGVVSAGRLSHWLGIADSVTLAKVEQVVRRLLVL